jgi:hypothetical protein
MRQWPAPAVQRVAAILSAFAKRKAAQLRSPLYRIK